jgi:hypothetical protein
VTSSLVLDLFSGTGSATQPFVECGKHRVIRIDNDPKRRPDIVADVRHLPLDRTIRPRYSHASPPCTQFSTGNLKRDPGKGMVLVRVAFKEVQRADDWTVENVRGAVRYISREFGEPVLRLDPWYLWGSFVPKVTSLPKKGRKLTQPYFKFHRDGRAYLHRYDQRGGIEAARIPRPLAEAVHKAVCEG